MQTDSETTGARSDRKGEVDPQKEEWPASSARAIPAVVCANGSKEGTSVNRVRCYFTRR